MKKQRGPVSLSSGGKAVHREYERMWYNHSVRDLDLLTEGLEKEEKWVGSLDVAFNE